MPIPSPAGRHGAPVPGLVRAVAAASALGGGAAIYVLCRPMTLRWSAWSAALGVEPVLVPARAWASPLAATLPEWCLFSLPDGAWLFSLLLALDGVWAGTGTPRAAVRAVACAAAMAHELGQAAAFVPGTFSWADVVSYGVATVAASVLTRGGPLPRSWGWRS